MRAILKAVRWMILHPWVSLGTVVCVIVLLLVIQPFSGDEKVSDSNQSPPNTKPNKKPDESLPIPGDGANGPPKNQPDRDRKNGDLKTPAPDPHDYDPEVKAEIEKQLREMPALQGLPVEKAGLYIDLTGAMPDGRPIITVTHRRDEVWANTQWVKFLRQFKDSGDAYVVLFKRN